MSKMLYVYATTLASISLLTGCISPAKSTAMVPKTLAIEKRNEKPVYVSVDGKGTFDSKTELVSSTAFAEALRKAIEKSQLFAKVDEVAGEGFKLEVTITGLTPPRPGFNMVAQMTSHWKLTRMPGGEVVFEDFIKKSYKATVGDAFVGATRMTRACEGAARETIVDGIQKLSQTAL